MWYFEEGTNNVFDSSSIIYEIPRYGTLKRVMWYFEAGGVEGTNNVFW